MNKQIEEMAKIINNEAREGNKCYLFGNGNKLAEAIYNAGYRRATDVAREIFEEIDGITDLFAKGIIGELEMYDMLAELKKKYESEGAE